MGAALGTALRHMNGKRVIEKGHAESCKAIADKQQKPPAPIGPEDRQRPTAWQYRKEA